MPNLPSASTITAPEDVLYAKAIGALHMNPALVQAFSPAARSLYDVAYNAVKGAVGDGINALGATAVGAATQALGPEVVNELSGIAEQLGTAIGDAVPIINIMMGIYNVISGIQSAADAPLIARVNSFLSVGTIQGSGKGGAITGADLFAPSREASVRDPMWYHYTDRPRSSLGAVLAAVTEDNEAEAPLSSYRPNPGPFRWPGSDPMRAQALDADTNLHHSSIVWDLASNLNWPGGGKSRSTDFSAPAGVNDRIGIPKARRLIYRTLRVAMGARGADQGATLLPIWADMLVDDFDNRALTAPFINNLLSWCYTDSSKLGPSAYGLEEVAGVRSTEIVDRPGVIGLNRQQRADFTSAIVGFADAWRRSRGKVAAAIKPHLAKAHMHLNFGMKRKPSPPAFYALYAWNPSTGWDVGRWALKADMPRLIGALASPSLARPEPSQWFAVYDAARRPIILASSANARDAIKRLK